MKQSKWMISLLSSLLVGSSLMMVGPSSSSANNNPKSSTPSTSFQTVLSYEITGGDQIFYSRVIDFNNDGLDDVLAVHKTFFKLFKNISGSSFEEQTIDGTNKFNADVYDVDRDGFVDLVFIQAGIPTQNDPTSSLKKVFWMRNEGNFVFSSPELFITNYSVNSDILGFSVGNFYRSELPSIEIYYSEFNYMSLIRLERNTDGTFKSRAILDQGANYHFPVSSIKADLGNYGRNFPFYFFESGSSKLYGYLPKNDLKTASYIETMNNRFEPISLAVQAPEDAYLLNLYQSGLTPGKQIAVGDVNNDGLQDFVWISTYKPSTADNSTWETRVFVFIASLNPITKTIQYTANKNSFALDSAGAFAYYIDLFDLNQDGFQDVIVTMSDPNNANQYLLLNKGDGTFQDQDDAANITSLYSSTQASQVFITDQSLVDYNKDGVTDIQLGRVRYVSYSQADQAAIWEFSLGVTTYSANSLNLTLDEQGGSGTELSDIGVRYNADRTFTTSGTNSIYGGDFSSSGTFDVFMPDDTTSDTLTIDLFREGAPGYLSLNGQTGTLTYYRGKLDGTFYAYPIAEDMMDFDTIKTADLNRNGDIEVLIVNEEGGEIRHFEVSDEKIEPLTGTALNAFKVTPTPSTTTSVEAVVEFDSGTMLVNGSAVNSGDSVPVNETVNVFAHTAPDGATTRAFAFPTSSVFFDPMTMTQGTRYTISNLKFITSLTAPTVPGLAIRGVEIMDIDKNARLDLIIGYSTGRIDIHLASGAEGQFSLQTNEDLSNIQTMTAIDFDGNSFMDIALYDATLQSIHILAFDAENLVFTTSELRGDIADADFLLSADFNFDAYADLMYFDGQHFNVLFNASATATGTYSPYRMFTPTIAVTNVVTMDGNADGFLDIYVISSTESKVHEYASFYNAVLILGTPVLDGFNFTFWAMDELGETPVDFSTPLTGNVTIYAQYEIAAYDITYVLDGATENNNPAQYDPSGDDVLLVDPVKEGYTFLGWYLDAELTQVITTLDSAITGDTTLYASWEATTYTITYVVGNGVNSSTNPLSYTIEGSETLEDATGNEGYVFAGWYDNPELSGTPLTEIPLGSSGDLTLYAAYTLTSYTVTYDVGDGENSPNNPTSYTIESPTITLDDAAPADGYTFSGWYDNAQFTGNVITEIALGSSGNLTLYAQYDAIEYTLTYTLNGGTNDENNPSTYTTDQSDITLLDPTRLYYDFLGWYDNADFLGNEITTITQNSLGNQTLYAKWTATVYTITYDVSGGTNSRYNITSFTVETSPFTLDEAALDGHTFEKWTLGTSSGNEIIEIDSSLAGSDLTLVANFQIIEYSIFYELGGGTNSANNPITYNILDAFTFEDPSKLGYQFDGWFTNPSFTGTAVTEIVAGSTGVLALYAKWTADSLLVQHMVYYVVGSTVSEELVEDGQSPTQVPTSPTLPDRTFRAWLDEQGNDVDPSTVTISEVTFFIADFETSSTSTSFTVTYIVDTTLTTEVVASGEGLSQIPSSPTKVGYTFKHWLINETSYSDLSTFSVSEDVIILAVFERDENVTLVDVYFVVDQSATKVSVTVNEPVDTLPSDPSKVGYTFQGWFVDGQLVDLLTYTFSETTLVFAHFEADSVTVTTSFRVSFLVGSNVVASELVNEGETVSQVPQDPTLVGSTFDGWYWEEELVDPASFLITEHVVFVAQFSEDTTAVTTSYTVFYLIAGTLTSETVNDGDTPSQVPSNPTQAGFTFSHWELNGVTTDPTTVNVTQNLVFIAVFTDNDPNAEPTLFHVYFLVGDSILASEDVESGATVQNIPADPSLANATFLGWYWNDEIVDPETFLITQDVIFVARFSSTITNATTFKVTYIVDQDVFSEVVNEGDSPSNVPSNPTKVGYTFNGWLLNGVITDPTSVTITADVVFIASFSEDSGVTIFTVTYVVGTTVTSETVASGGTLTNVPSSPTMENMIFDSWQVNGVTIDVSTYVVTQDVLVIAKFVPQTTITTTYYHVGFIVENMMVSSQRVEEGSTIPTVPPQPSLVGHTFKGWTVEGQVVDVSTWIVEGDVIFIAEFEALVMSTYHVTYIVHHDVFIETVSHGEALAAIPTIAERVGYKFEGWLEDGVRVDLTSIVITSDRLFIAEFTPLLMNDSDVVIQEDPTQDGLRFTFQDGEATLNGSPYVSGTWIYEAGDYELIITFTNGDVYTYRFTIGSSSNEPMGLGWLFAASMVLNGGLLAWLLLPYVSKKKVQVRYQMGKDTVVVHQPIDQRLRNIPTEKDAAFIRRGWLLDGQRIDETTFMVHESVTLVADYSTPSPQAPLSSKGVVSTPLDHDDKQEDDEEEEVVELAFASRGVDTFYQRLTSPLKREFAQYFMNQSQDDSAKVIYYVEGQDNGVFFNQILFSLRRVRSRISFALFQAIVVETIELAQSNAALKASLLAGVIALAYYRRQDKEFLHYTEVLCQEAIGIHRDQLKTRNTYVYVYKRLAILLEKAKRYEEAINLVHEAMSYQLKDKTVGEYSQRLDRLQEKQKAAKK